MLLSFTIRCKIPDDSRDCVRESVDPHRNSGSFGAVHRQQSFDKKKYRFFMACYAIIFKRSDVPP